MKSYNAQRPVTKKNKQNTRTVVCAQTIIIYELINRNNNNIHNVHNTYNAKWMRLMCHSVVHICVSTTSAPLHSTVCLNGLALANFSMFFFRKICDKSAYRLLTTLKKRWQRFCCSSVFMFDQKSSTLHITVRMTRRMSFQINRDIKTGILYDHLRVVRWSTTYILLPKVKNSHAFSFPSVDITEILHWMWVTKEREWEAT